VAQASRGDTCKCERHPSFQQFAIDGQRFAFHQIGGEIIQHMLSGAFGILLSGAGF
jgi:hypothetical protein